MQYAINYHCESLKVQTSHTFEICWYVASIDVGIEDHPSGALVRCRRPMILCRHPVNDGTDPGRRIRILIRRIQTKHEYENRHKQKFQNDPAKKVSHGDKLILDLSLADIEFVKIMELHQKRASHPITPANQLEEHHRGLFRWNVCYVFCFQTRARIVSTSMQIWAPPGCMSTNIEEWTYLACGLNFPGIANAL